MPHHSFHYPDTFVVVNGYRMHFYHSGGEAPLTFVMLHGSGATSHVYRRFFPYLAAAGFGCIAPDLIGFGQSDKPNDARTHTFDFHSDNLETFIRELGLRNVVLVGHEWGGLFALDYAINRPDNAIGLVLTDCGVFLPKHSFGFIDYLQPSMLKDLVKRRLNGAPNPTRLRRPRYNYGEIPEPNQESAATRSGFRRMTSQANLGYNALRMRAIRNSLPKLETPTLLIRSGGRHLFGEAESEYLQHRLKYSRTHYLPAYGDLHEDHFRTVANEILNFLSPIDSPLLAPAQA